MLAQVQIRKNNRLIFKLRQANMNDASAVTAMLNASAIDQIGAPNVSQDLLESDWDGPNFDLKNSVRIAETLEGQIIGYVEVWDTDSLPVSNFVWARVDPEFEGLGVGTKMMQWAEKRLQQTITRVPDDLMVGMRSACFSNHEPSKILLESLDMSPIRYFWRMEIELNQMPPKPKWPEGIILSNLAELGDLRAIYRAFDDAFQDHFGFVPQSEEEKLADWEHWIATDKEFDPRLWMVALDGQEIAGICICRSSNWEDPDMGWVNIFGVRRPWRKQGLGLAFLQHAFSEFYRRGKLRTGLMVDADSLTGATRLYIKAGMHVTRELHDYEKVLRPGHDIRRKQL